MDGPDRNLEVYNAPEVVGVYAARAGLHPAEAYAFDKYIQPGAAILDIGVGGGRTTPHLAAKASTYVGIDYAAGMVEACDAKFPGVAFFHENACDLGRFQDASFDVAVFSSFNGIGYIRADANRQRALREIARVLKRGGHFIFSAQNARMLGVWPILTSAKPARKAWLAAKAVGRSLAVAARRLPTTMFARGLGYGLDQAHGGLWVFFCTPETIRPEVEAAGFTILEVLNGYHPLALPRAFTPWYYYVLEKR